MRKFIRHPAGIPMEYALEGLNRRRRERLRNVGFGGLCFHCASGVEPGTRIHIRIPACQPPLDVDGVVAWCAARGGGYDAGVAFDAQAVELSVRMVEQICHIEQYRLDIAQSEGRGLSGVQAARELIEKCAARFPRPGKAG